MAPISAIIFTFTQKNVLCFYVLFCVTLEMVAAIGAMQSSQGFESAVYQFKHR